MLQPMYFFENITTTDSLGLFMTTLGLNVRPQDNSQNREKLCQERLRKARGNKTPAWTNEDVKYVLKHKKGIFQQS